MGEFFKPLRRKIGVVTLVLACLIAVAWTRSLWVRHEIHIPFEQQEMTRTLISADQGLLWLSRERTITEFHTLSRRIQSEWTEAEKIGVMSQRDNGRPDWKNEFLGFRMGEVEYREPLFRYWHAKVIRIPYWSIVIPLTLLAAWLLLSTPRARSNI